MRKLISLIILVSCASFVFAQDLVSKIPAKANVVGTINIGKLTQLMTVEEWNNSNFGKKILEMSAKSGDESIKSFNDLGLSLTGNTYYFHTENDSMQYNYVLAPVADLAKFDVRFKNKAYVKLANNTRLTADEDSTGFMMWNNQQVMYVKGSLKETYFYNPEVAARHGLYSYPNYGVDTTVVVDTLALPNQEYNQPQVDTVVMEDIAPVVGEPLPPPPPKHKKPAATKKKGASIKSKGSKAKKVTVKKKEPEITMDEVADIVDSTAAPVAEPYPAYDYNKELLIKQRIAAACTEATIKDLFTKTSDSSIVTNPEYMKSVDANAAAGIWIGRPTDLYSGIFSAYNLYGKGLGNNFFNHVNNAAYKNFTAKIFLEEKQIRLTSAAEVSDDMMDVQQKIFSRKLNKKIISYINSDSLLGYLSWSVDTKAYLENFPKVLENAYGNLGLGLNHEEYDVIGEFVSFLIDEDAISKLVKGDGIVLFNGLYAQPTTYTDYEYDSSYHSTPVVKSKIDTLPKFLFMLSSEENNFERKLINYGIKKEMVKQQDGFYELIIPRSPVQLFFTNKDGLFFLTNSIKEMLAITSGKYPAKISKQEKNWLLDHNYALYANPQKIAGRLADTQVGAAENLSSVVNTLNKMGNVRATMQPVKGNIMGGEMTLELPADKSNSLKYIFEVFDGLLK